MKQGERERMIRVTVIAVPKSEHTIRIHARDRKSRLSLENELFRMKSSDPILLDKRRCNVFTRMRLQERIHEDFFDSAELFTTEIDIVSKSALS